MQMTDTETIERLVMDYKDTHEPLSLYKILNHLEPYFMKFYHFSMRHSKFYDENIKQFLSTYLGAVKRKRSDLEQQEVIKFCNRISMTYLFQEKDDVLLDMYTICIHILDKYEYNSRSFLAYFSSAFPYYFGRVFTKSVLSPSVFDSSTMHTIDNYIDFSTLDYEYSEVEDDFGYLTDDWTYSISEIEAFNVLTPLEKKLILLYYQDMMNDKEIAKMLGYHINTINEMRNRAVKKMEDFLRIKRTRTRRTSKHT